MSEKMTDDKATFYDIDRMLLDVVINDPFSLQKGVRPWLSVCVEHSSSAVVAWILSTENTPQQAFARLLHEAFSSSEERPIEGIPQSLCVITDLTLSARIQHVLHSMKVSICSRRVQPSIKGRAEHFLSFIQTRLLIAQEAGKSATGSSYASSDEEDAELTYDALKAFLQVLLRNYNSTPLDETGRTCLSTLQEDTSMRSADAAVLALLLQETQKRRVMKRGILYHGESYWHPALASLPGKEVEICVDDEQDGVPQTIEVFASDQWMCTASRSFSSTNSE